MDPNSSSFSFFITSCIEGPCQGEGPHVQFLEDAPVKGNSVPIAVAPGKVRIDHLRWAMDTFWLAARGGVGTAHAIQPVPVTVPWSCRDQSLKVFPLPVEGVRSARRQLVACFNSNRLDLPTEGLWSEMFRSKDADHLFQPLFNAGKLLIR